MFIWKKIQGLFGSSQPEAEHHQSHHKHVHLTSVQRKARTQIEFYFSPSNIQRDSYMKGLIDEGEDRFCPIAQFFKFNKIQELGISEEDLLVALSSSRKLEVDAERKLVRTKVPFKADPRIDFRTLFIEGLDKEETQESLREIFEKQLGKVCYIGMKNIIYKASKGKKFSGKVDVELESEEKAAAAVESGLEYKGRTLAVKLVATCKSDAKKEKKADAKIPKPNFKQGKPAREEKKAEEKVAENEKQSEEEKTEKKSPKKPITPRRSPRSAKPKKSE